jgi:hypothetical protein
VVTVAPRFNVPALSSLQVLLLEAGKPSFWNKLVNLPAGVVK